MMTILEYSVPVATTYIHDVELEYVQWYNDLLKVQPERRVLGAYD